MRRAVRLAVGPKNSGQLEWAASRTGGRMGAQGLLPQAQVIQRVEGGGGLQQPPAREVEVVDGVSCAGWYGPEAVGWYAGPCRIPTSAWRRHSGGHESHRAW